MRLRIQIIHLFISLLFIANVHSQFPDSALKALNGHHKEDLKRLELLTIVADRLVNIDPDKGLEYSKEAIDLATSLKQEHFLPAIYCTQASHQATKSMFPEALASYNTSLRLSEANKDSIQMAICYNGMGTLYGRAGDFPRSKEFFLKSLELNRNGRSKELFGSTVGNLGNIYREMGDYPKALESYQQALELSEQDGNQNYTGAYLASIGIVHDLKGDHIKALEYHKKSLTIFEHTGNKMGVAQNLANIGIAYTNLSEFGKAIEYNIDAMRLLQEMGNQAGVAYVLGNIGACYGSLGDYPKALQYYQQALKIEQDIGDKTTISKNYSNIGNIYKDIGNYDQALLYYDKAMVLDKEIDDQYNIAENLTNMGSAYHDLGKHMKALDYFQQALAIKQKLGVNDASNLSNIGRTYIDIGEYAKGYDHLKRSLAISENADEKAITADNYNGIGIIFSNIPDSVVIDPAIKPGNNYNNAVEYLQKALLIGTQNNLLDVQRNSWQNLSTAYERAGDYTKSIDAYKHFIIIRDSILNNETKKKIMRLEIQYEFDKKEDSMNLQQQITDGKLKQQVLLSKEQQQQLIINRNALQLANTEKDLQKLAYLKTQADLQNEQFQKGEKEKQLTIAEKEKLLKTAEVTTLSQENILNKLKRRQQWFYSIGILVLLGFLASYLFYISRLKQGRLKTELAKEKAIQEKKEAEFQRNLADVSLSALRSQMNPHFIFNCLNSIKLYTMQNDTVSASDYLTKFSRLIRLVMENSRNDRISLTAELEALRLYIEMEAMRFKEKLAYTITVDKNVEMDYIEIPPLLLQPYVENAIWHGLMHKESGGRIDITAEMKENESLLEINITDNGVGRARAEELRSKTATRHKSYGMKVTSERITLINQIYKTGANVTVNDINNGSGEIAGTRVTIQIPV